MDHDSHIRKAIVVDAQSIAHVHVVSSTDAYAPLIRGLVAADPAERARKWGRRLEAAENDPTRCYLVAVIDDEVVGFVGAGPARRDDLETELEVYVIHVLPACRGRGIGGQLWSTACHELRGTRLPSLYVETYAELRCCSFYEARGGELIERQPVLGQGGETTKVVYRWADGQPSCR